MLFFRRHPIAQAAVPASVITESAPLPAVAPKMKLPALVVHGAKTWKQAVAYAEESVRDRSDPELAATLILRISRDFEIVRHKKGREFPVRHPAFGESPEFLSESGKRIPFEKVMTQALTNSKFDKFYLSPNDAGELIVRSPSGKWRAVVGEVIPEPWYRVLVMVGKTAMSGRDLDRYSYHAKVHLFGDTDPFSDGIEPRMMTQRHRLKRGEMRLFKGNAAGWQSL